MSAPLIDAAVLDDLVEHLGRRALQPVIDLFLDESRQYAAAIVAAAGLPDGHDAVRRAAHSLKSSAGQLGAAALAEEAAGIEQAAGDGAPLAGRAASLSRCAAATAAAFTARLKAG
jgi:HPt (histidine-containing phosphotransfer) domain-containing protein